MEQSESAHQKSESRLSKSRRAFLKKSAAGGLGLAAAYVAPRFTSFGPKSAYASITGGGTPPDPTATPTATPIPDPFAGVGVYVLQGTSSLVRYDAVSGVATTVKSGMDDADVKAFTRDGQALIAEDRPDRNFNIYDVASGAVTTSLALPTGHGNLKATWWDPTGGRVVSTDSANPRSVCVNWYEDGMVSCMTLPLGANPGNFHFLPNDETVLIGRIRQEGTHTDLLIIKLDNISHTAGYRILHLNASNPGTEIVAIDSTPEGSLTVLMGGFNGSHYTRKYNVGTYAGIHWSLINNDNTEIQPLDFVEEGSCSSNDFATTPDADFFVRTCTGADDTQFRPSNDDSVWRVDSPNMHSLLYADSTGNSHSGLACAKKTGGTCDLWMASVNVTGGKAIRLIDAVGNTRQISVPGDWAFAGVAFD